jgi:NAD(P)-dependent dehydrogenase (short-subunit alcohol dehydrogenase family)
MRVKDKSIIVTGAGQGIGEGIAKRLAQEGASVLVNDINADNGEKVVAAIQAAGGKASFFRADVTKSADVKALVQAAVDRHGKLDAMVNNAGWTHRNRPALEVSEEEFDKVYAINMKSIYLSTIHAVPAFRANKGGSFINIASTAGVRPASGPHLVQRLEGRGHHHQQVAGGRVRSRQHPRELHQPGVQPRHRPVGRVRRRPGRRGAQGEVPRHHPARPLLHRAGRRQRLPLPGQ